MNAEQLLKHYERVAEAPDAIARLRQVVRDLAVVGKLVFQSADDEPAHELIRRVRAEKQRLGIKHVQPTDQNICALPQGWASTSIGDYAIDVFTGPFGSALHQHDYVEGGVPLVNPSHMRHDRICPDRKVSVSPATASRLSSYALAPGDVVMARRGEVGRAALVEADQDGWLCGTGSFFLKFLPEVNRQYLLLVLRTTAMRSFLVGQAVGTTMVNLNHNILRRAPLNIPPLAEQHRIVAKVDELMALCDQLEAARAQREASRDRLTASTLARLNTSASPASPDGDAPKQSSFHSDACFALKALPALTTRPDQIKRLRQTILNLAVAGGLVPQDPDDEPAESLLSKLRKSRKSSDRIARQRSRLDLPQGWASAQLQDVAEVGTGLTPSKDQPRYFDGGNIPWINSGATSRKIIDSASRFVTEAAVRECRLKLYPVGSLLVALYGQGKTRGQVAELGIAATVNQALAVVRWVEGYEGLKGYVRLALTQQYESMREQAEGGPQPNLNVGKIKDLPLLVPPLAEQIRIVAKVDELMALCDQLETSLIRGENTRSRLLNALLHESLVPTEPALEAA